jgi:hypothetical protein
MNKNPSIGQRKIEKHFAISSFERKLSLLLLRKSLFLWQDRPEPEKLNLYQDLLPKIRNHPITRLILMKFALGFPDINEEMRKNIPEEL